MTTYFCRAFFLKCPLCGKKPLFSSLLKTRSFRDWFDPLDGCPRCGYAYVPEPGYYLAVTGVASLGVGGLVGWMLFLGLKFFWGWGNSWLFPLVALSVLVCSVLFVRHAKAFYLAADFLLHSDEEEDGEDDGDLPLPPSPVPPSLPTTVDDPPDPEKHPQKKKDILSVKMR